MTLNNKIGRVLALVIGAALCGSVAAQGANSFPAGKPIKFVVPFPAGSATDNVARIVAQAMSEALGTTAAVENKPGANGILGAEAVKAAPADGLTLLVTTNTTQAANVSLYKKLSYDPVKDFTPIGKIGVTGFVLMVPPQFPANTIKEFVSYAKANPDKLSYGHGSAGSLVSAALMAQMAGIQVQPVPYKGIPPALTDLLGGSIGYAFADVGNAAVQIQGKKLKGLGVTTNKRSSRLPDVPTIAESGVSGYEVAAWFGIVAPANLPGDIQKKLTDSLLAQLAKADVRERIANAGVDVEPQNSAQLAATIDAEIKKWAGWVKAANIQPE
jgi:tripartite-type tricarboxylate transporter receptor subunit TctC